MSFDPALDSVITTTERQLLQRRLSPIERQILERSWYGQTYAEIARNSPYGNGYIKAIGSQLWAQLSTALGTRVTKKNLRLTLTVEAQAAIRSRAAPASQSGDRAPTTVQPQPLSVPVPGAPLPLDSPFYIERPPIEQMAYAALDTPGCALRVRAPSKMGTSSLLVRLLAQATTKGYRTVEIDCKEAEIATLGSLNRFLRWLCATVSRYLDLSLDLDAYWDDDLGSKISCKLYFEAGILKSLDAPLAIAFTELHRLFEFPHVASDVLSMLRSWHEQAQRSPLWQQLRFILSYATENYVPLNLAQSPFNVGISLQLPPLTPAQVTTLAQSYQLSWNSDRDTPPLMQMVGGHPYLVSLAFYHLRRGNISLEELLAAAPTPAGIYSYHLRGYLTILREQPDLAIALHQAITTNGERPVEAIAAHKLASLGLVELDGTRACVTCQLYERYFQAQLDSAELSGEAAQSTDPVTQLPNRAALQHYLRSSWPIWSSNEQPLSLLLIGIDRFEPYSAARGQDASDAYLHRFALLLHRTIPEAALIARYDSVQFAIAMVADAKLALGIAEKMRDSYAAFTPTYDRTDLTPVSAETDLTLSIGVSCWLPPAPLSPSQLLATTESALMAVQQRGGNDVGLLNSTPIPDSFEEGF